jgi:hypothetical protein
MHHLRSLGKVFGVSIEYLLWGDDEKIENLDNLSTTKVHEGWVKLSIEVPANEMDKMEIITKLLSGKGKL